MVEADNPVHLGAGKIERARDPRHCIGWDVAEAVVDRMQNWHQRASSVGETGDDFVDGARFKGGVAAAGISHSHFSRYTTINDCDLDPHSCILQPDSCAAIRRSI